MVLVCRNPSECTVYGLCYMQKNWIHFIEPVCNDCVHLLVAANLLLHVLQYFCLHEAEGFGIPNYRWHVTYLQLTASKGK